MKVLVGTTNGLVKTFDLESKATVSLWGEQKPDTNVECLEWALPNSEKEVIAGYENGAVKVWDATSGKAVIELGNYEGKIRGAFCFPKITGRVVVACTQPGKLSVRSVNIKSEDNEKEAPLASCEVQRNGPTAQVMRMRHSPHNKERVGIVGKGVEPQIWNFETTKCIWKAKPVTLNFLRQPKPVENMDFQHLVDNRNCIVTGTRQRLVRVYDTSIKGHKPILEVEVPHFEYSIISVGVTSHQPKSVFVTEGSGRMTRLDLRNGRLETVFRGAHGAVRGLAYHPTKPLMATACLDRCIRVYDLKKPKLENNRLSEFNMPFKVYAKQRLSSVLFSKDETVQEKKEDVKKRKIDTLWDSLETLPETKEEEDEDDDDDMPKQRVVFSKLDGTHVSPLGQSSDEEDEDDAEADEDDGGDDEDEHEDEDDEDTEGDGEDVSVSEEEAEGELDSGSDQESGDEDDLGGSDNEDEDGIDDNDDEDADVSSDDAPPTKTTRPLHHKNEKTVVVPASKRRKN